MHDAEVVCVEGDGAAAERREVDDGRGDLRAYSLEALQPSADLFGAIVCEEIQGERAIAGGDLLQGELEARRFDLGEGDDLDGVLDVGEGSVADGLPVCSKRAWAEAGL